MPASVLHSHSAVGSKQTKKRQGTPTSYHHHPPSPSRASFMTKALIVVDGPNVAMVCCISIYDNDTSSQSCPSCPNRL